MQGKNRARGAAQPASRSCASCPFLKKLPNALDESEVVSYNLVQAQAREWCTRRDAGEEHSLTEQEIIRVLSRDYSAGTERFREALLARCLSFLGQADRSAARPEDLEDDDLEMLAAAGSVTDYGDASALDAE